MMYCYINLALTNVPNAIPLIREVLHAGNVSARSWILFFDRDLQAEWIGIYPQSPPPSRNQKHTALQKIKSLRFRQTGGKGTPGYRNRIPVTDGED